MTQAARNILFIMCDQLRWDYLSCAGRPGLQTPNIDQLAAHGVRFSRAYVQSPVCGRSPQDRVQLTARVFYCAGGWLCVPERGRTHHS
jgi:arylsulfatase A-like enzyme